VDLDEGEGLPRSVVWGEGGEYGGFSWFFGRWFVFRVVSFVCGERYGGGGSFRDDGGKVTLLRCHRIIIPMSKKGTLCSPMVVMISEEMCRRRHR